MNIIAFAGPAGSGKNTAARAIRSRSWQRGVSWCFELAIAQPLYESLEALSGIEDAPFRGALAAACADRTFKTTGHPALAGLSPRTALQRLGDWAREQFGEDYLLRRLESRIKYGGSLVAEPLILITDVRTEPEAQWVRDQGGLVVHIARPDALEPGDTHHTEQPLTYHQGDHDLLNNGTIADLGAAAWGIAEAWLAAREVAS